MTKLFVDDIRNAPDDTWAVARTITSAIDFIEQFRPEVISLDHDISHQVHMDELSRPFPCGETFKPVAKYIAAFFNQGYTPKIILHTSNPVGAAEMARILTGYDIERKSMGAANRLEMEV